MKRQTGITNIESKVMIPATLLEVYVNNKHYPAIVGDENISSFTAGYKSMKWCSEQLTIGGALEIHTSGQKNNHCFYIPVTSSFLVVCTQKNEQGYKVTWSCSLS